MLNDRIKEYRKQNNWTQAELAKKINVSQQTIGSWEVGRAEPNSDSLKELASLFGISVDALLGVENRKGVITTSSKAETVAAHIDDDVNEDEMKEILSFIDYIKNRDHKK